MKYLSKMYKGFLFKPSVYRLGCSGKLPRVCTYPASWVYFWKKLYQLYCWEFYILTCNESKQESLALLIVCSWELRSCGK